MTHVEPDFATPFLDALEAAGRPFEGDVERLTAALAEVWRGACEQRAELSVSPASFMTHLAASVDPDAPAEVAVGRIRADDLLLALACGEGVPAALARFEAQVLPRVEPALVRLRISPEMVDEVKQTVRAEVLVRTSPERAPGIMRYSGRGRLASWLRIVAVRAAGRLMDRSRREVLLTESVLGDLTPPSGDPELEYLKGTYRAQFRDAFSGALTQLPDEQRDLLCQHYLERLTIDDLGAALGVHRATAARRIVRAREMLLQATRQNLMRQVRVGQTECDSILRLIESQLMVSIPGGR